MFYLIFSKKLFQYHSFIALSASLVVLIIFFKFLQMTKLNYKIR